MCFPLVAVFFISYLNFKWKKGNNGTKKYFVSLFNTGRYDRLKIPQKTGMNFKKFQGGGRFFWVSIIYTPDWSLFLFSLFEAVPGSWSRNEGRLQHRRRRVHEGRSRRGGQSYRYREFPYNKHIIYNPISLSLLGQIWQINNTNTDRPAGLTRVCLIMWSFTCQSVSLWTYVERYY